MIALLQLHEDTRKQEKEQRRQQRAREIQEQEEREAKALETTRLKKAALNSGRDLSDEDDDN